MSDQRMKYSCRSDNLQMTGANFKQSFIKNDTEFPSLSTSETTIKNVIHNASDYCIPSTYSSRLKSASKNNDKVASQTEKIRNNNSSHMAKYVNPNKMVTVANGRFNEFGSSKRNYKEYNTPHVRQPYEETEKKNFRQNRSDDQKWICPTKTYNHKSSISDGATNVLDACDRLTNDNGIQSTFRQEDILLNSDCESKKTIFSPKNKLPADASAKVKTSADCEVKSKTKKKNRKSKIKRDAALQSGKLLVLTPEVHSRIFNKANRGNSSLNQNSFVNINNSEEYPELGQAVSQKKSMHPVKSLNNDDHKKINKINFTLEIPSSHNIENNTSSEKEELNEAVTKSNQNPVFSSSESAGIKKKKSNTEKASHPANSIVILLEDVLLAKSKAKEARCCAKTQVPHDRANKAMHKKVVGIPHNVLDSSSPAVKRGKERENPKPKKKSQLKKIILMDRQHRKDQRFTPANEKALENVESSNESFDKDLPSTESEKIGKTSEICDTLVFNHIEQQMHELQLNCEMSLLNKNTSEYRNEIDLENAEKLSINEESNASEAEEQTKDPFTITNYEPVHSDMVVIESIEKKLTNEKFGLLPESSNSSCLQTDDDLFLKNIDTGSHDISSYENCRNIANNVTNFNITSAYTEKEILQAVKVVIHTRNFRPYCKNVICKELEKSVLALLDDLTRFQDRLHQRDPMKARIKRRLVNGIKEVMKNIKLKKLKCVIIATNIENVETEGGLNDTIENLVSSASNHCIPCVYALHRKVLGRACRKPVGISCVGIFNYEGSEMNFKKIMELQIEGQKNYLELQESVKGKLNDSIIENIFKVQKSSPENLQSLRETVLTEVYKMQM